MAWGRSQALRGAFFLFGVLLLLQYMYGSRLNSAESPNMNSAIKTLHAGWPKRTRPKPTHITQTNATNFIYKNNSEIELSWIINQYNISDHVMNQSYLYSTPSTNINLNSSSISGNLLYSSNIKSVIDTYVNESSNATHSKINNSVTISNNEVKNNTKRLCPPVPPGLEGPVKLDLKSSSMNSLMDTLLSSVLRPGGTYSPPDCTARDRVAIIVPYRDREEHLSIFLNNIHPFLIKQQIHYTIYIIEQISGTMFNRAALMNVGYVEALRDGSYDSNGQRGSWDCFVFHDVDLLPLDDRNLYNCPEQPRHMSVAIDVFSFKLPYSGIFGGVSAMTTEHFKTVNGFSNMFWGWGGEDDDMANRIKHHGLHISRYPFNIARYSMLTHAKEKANPKRYDTLNQGKKRYNSEGLNSLEYKRKDFQRLPLYTWLLVEISPPPSS